MPCLPSSPAATGHAHTIGEHKAVDEMVDGFGIGRLQGILGSAAGQAAEMDDMYAGMLGKMEKSNIRVLEQVCFANPEIPIYAVTAHKFILLQNCVCV